jgi:hypothetical protein
MANGIVLPKLGGLSPSLTMQANAFRVSAYIINIKAWKGETFRPAT